MYPAHVLHERYSKKNTKINQTKFLKTMGRKGKLLIMERTDRPRADSIRAGAELVAILLSLILAMTSCKDRSSDGAAGARAPAEPAKSAHRRLVQCPVCGLSFEREDSVKTFKYRQKTYFFYLEDHFREFSLHPEKYTEDNAH
jgi:YHS domain-containing protein